MKKITLFTLLLIPFLGLAQTTKPIEGFLGIKFGSSKAEVTAAMQAKGATLTNNSGDFLDFQNVKLGERAATNLEVDFINDKAWQSVFYFQADEQPQTVDYYNSLVSDISGVYGKGEATKSFKSPFEDGDGNELEALQGGYATFFTNWNSGKNELQATIRPVKDDLDVFLFYIDGTLEAEHAAKEKEKDKAQF